MLIEDALERTNKKFIKLIWESKASELESL
jgi:hypothetical protein